MASPLQTPASPLGYQPFEYWKGPKKVVYPARKPREGAARQAAAGTNAQATAGVNDSGTDHLSPSTTRLQPVQREPRAAHQLINDVGNEKLDLSLTGGPIGHGDHPPTWDRKEDIIQVQADLGQRRPSQPSTFPTDLPERTPRSMSRFYDDEGDASWWDFRHWRKRVWAVIVAVIVVIIVVVVAVVVTEEKKNAYPNYSKLNYVLSETYSPSTFFDNFDYFVGWDPSHGFVHYVPQEQATSLNLTSSSSTSAVLRVDTSVGPSSVPNASTGRFSVRVQSKTQYSSGLFLFDVLHAPIGCATWPALWLTDPAHWPDNGEIDVMETLNQASVGNQMTLHTTNDCTMDVKRLMTGTAGQTDCYNGTADNEGCNVAGGNATAGDAFNAAGGGVMALEWRDAGIRIWQFARASIPADVQAGDPDPSSWGTALADFPDTSCDVASHFQNQSIIVDINLCGDANPESVYAASGCPSNCSDYVANNPSAFADAFWEFASFQIYTAS